MAGSMLSAALALSWSTFSDERMRNTPCQPASSKLNLKRPSPPSSQESVLQPICCAVPSKSPGVSPGGSTIVKGKPIASTTYSSVGMDNWETWVTAEYGDASDDTYKRAFAEVIVGEYAQRYGNLIDGWWFDNGGISMNAPLLREITRKHNPDVHLTFNNDMIAGVSDFADGHPTPVRRALASDDINLAYMLYPIEASQDGYIPDQAGKLMLGHMFMPLQETWNSGDIVWTVEKGADWQERCLNAGCAWTWNVDTMDSQSILRPDTVQHMKDNIEQMASPNTAPLLSDIEYVLSEIDSDQEYTNSDSILATDTDNDPISFTLIDNKGWGFDWLSVSETGQLSGSPNISDISVTLTTLQASDGRGGIATTILRIVVNE